VDKIIKDEFYNKLTSDKIKIKWNKDPIKMNVFLSFLKIKLIRSNVHLGSCNGWTLFKNEDHKLMIGGGIVGGIEYLNTIQYGEGLSNPYSNYVNPFFIFDIMTREGRQFFIDYYKQDMEKILSKSIDEIVFLESKLENKRNVRMKIQDEIIKINEAK
jgi:hypothetical protein